MATHLFCSRPVQACRCSCALVFFYISDDGDILALRTGDWKLVLMEQRAKQLMCWFEPFVKLRAPKMFNLRRDPFERVDENSNTYWDWVISHAYLLYVWDAGARRAADQGIRAIPAATEAGRLQPRCRAQADPGCERQQLPLAPRPLGEGTETGSDVRHDTEGWAHGLRRLALLQL